MVINSEVRWGPAIHRFGKHFDHGLLSAAWRWRTKKTEKKTKHDFSAMTSQSWTSFDEALRIKLQKRHEPKKTDKDLVVKGSNGYKKETDETDYRAELTTKYSELTECVNETIKELVPEKQWIKKNGRVVSKETKELFTKRVREYQKKEPTKERRKEWNKKIRIACRNDYRQWVARWAQKIEDADNRGDTREIYRGVKALSGKQFGASKRPTQRKSTEQGEEEIGASPEEKDEEVRASSDVTGH